MRISDWSSDVCSSDLADEAVVQIDEQQCVLAAPGHQNSVSISEGWPFDRAASRNSRSKAARTARMVSSRVAGLPVSMREIVSWRRPVFSPSCVWLQPCRLRARRTRLPICRGVRASSVLGGLLSRYDKSSISGSAHKWQICARPYNHYLTELSHKA